VYYLYYFYIFHGDYVWYYHLFWICPLISSSEIYFFHCKIHSHYLPFLQVIVLSISQTQSINCLWYLQLLDVLKICIMLLSYFWNVSLIVGETLHNFKTKIDGFCDYGYRKDEALVNINDLMQLHYLYFIDINGQFVIVWADDHVMIISWSGTNIMHRWPWYDCINMNKPF